MKTKGILIAMIFVVFTSFNIFAIAEINTNLPDSIKHRINIRVNQHNEVVLRADCLKDQKRTNLVLKVFSDKGQMVYAVGFHKKGGIYRGFDMKELPEGKYNFVVYKNLKEVYSKQILKSNEYVSTDDGNSKIAKQEL
jgi:hypothetical protein